MAKDAWIALVVSAITWAAAPQCFAEDDTEVAYEAPDATPGVTTIDELLAATTYTDFRVIPAAFAPEPGVTDDPGIALDLGHRNALGRTGREKSLAFLTFSNQGRSRLFLGINEDGLFGMHLTGK